MKTGIIYSVALYQREGGDSMGQGEGRRLNGRRIRPVGGGAQLRHTILIGIVIFLVLIIQQNCKEIYKLIFVVCF